MNLNPESYMTRIMHSRELNNLGIAQFDGGNFKHVLEIFNESLTHDPQSIVAIQYRGMCGMQIAFTDPNLSLENRTGYVNQANLDFKRTFELFNAVMLDSANIIKALDPRLS